MLDLKNDKKFVLSIACILLLGLTFRGWNFTRELGNDDQRWLATATEFCAEHEASVHPVYYARALFRAVLFAWGNTFSFSLASTTLLMLLLSCVTTLMLAIAGRIAFDQRAGIWAALIYCFTPLSIVYDPLTLPDGLALCLLSIAVALFSKYLATSSLAWLVFSAFFLGLGFPAKEYFVLPAIPAFIVLLLNPNSKISKSKRTAVFFFFFSSGVSVDFLLNFADSGNALASFTSSGDYGERLIRGNPALHDGFQGFVRSLIQRFDYFRVLFSGQGISTGVVFIWGALILFNRRTTNNFALFLVGTIVLMSLFLMFMPASVKPWVFVEMQPRYLGVLLPFLALGGGYAISELFKTSNVMCKNPTILVAILISLLTNVAIPNNLSNPNFNRSSNQLFDGIYRVLRGELGNNTQVLILPNEGFEVVMPDYFNTVGPSIHFVDSKDSTENFEALLSTLPQQNVGVLIPRSRIKHLQHLLVRGEDITDAEVPSEYSVLVNWLNSEGYKKEPVMVPDTIFMRWASRFGIVSSEQQLVAWLFYKGPIREN